MGTGVVVSGSAGMAAVGMLVADTANVDIAAGTAAGMAADIAAEAEVVADSSRLRPR